MTASCPSAAAAEHPEREAAPDPGGDATGLSAYALAEVIQEGSLLRVQRARRRRDGLPVVLKRLKPAGATAADLARFDDEARLLARLPLPGVIRLEEFITVPTPVMVLEEFGGHSLERLPSPMALQPFLELATGLAETLAQLHARNVVHKNIGPGNILLNPATGAFRLIDFALADELPQRTGARPSPVPPDALPFIAPEQTGRMNRAVDARADLYSLGATFYWLLTGVPPFEAADDLGLIHCHLATRPMAPRLRNPQVPESLSAIVLKLLAKMAEERYQSARGLKADLERCLQGLRAQGSVPDFLPGRDDFSDRLQPPQRLFGREGEIRQLVAALDRASRGGSELVFVAGFSGVGKSALVRQLQRPVYERRGYFIEGKFDQLHRNVPCAGLAQAFDSFVSQVLMEEEERLVEWRGRIREAVRHNGRLLTGMIPALEQLLGPQPPEPPVAAAESRNRFAFLVLDFVRAIASPERPLVLFLDDLQWIDAASLHILHRLARAVGIRGLLIVGGYRDNEVDRLHPLAVTLEALRAEGSPPEVLNLASLDEAATNQLIAHVLHEAPDATVPLTRLVYAKTGGNAFFTLQMLRSLAQTDAVGFDAAARRWRWDLDALARQEITDNVVALMEARLRTLPPPTGRLLTLAACIGYRFSLPLLVAASGETDAAARAALEPALRDGLIVATAAGLQFAHDRVRQGAYALIPAPEQPRVHLEVGRRLLPLLPDEGDDELIFAVADNLNAGSALMAEPRERLTLARLALRAGVKARRAAAFDVAGHYFRAGLALLPADGWHGDYALTLALHKECAQCEYLAGRHAAADEIIATALRNALDAVDQAEIHAIQVVVYITQNRFTESIAAGLAALRLFDMEMPDPADPAALRAAADRALALYGETLARTDLARVAEAPEMTDRKARVCMELLLHMVLAAYYLDRTLYTLLTTSMANLALRHGNSSAAALGYVLMGAISVTELRDFAAAKSLGELAMRLNERYPNPALEGGILMFYANTVAPWFLPLADAAPIQRRGFAAAMEAGALNDAANCLWGLLRNALVSGGPLTEAARECDNVITFTERIHDPGFRSAMVFMRQVIRCFQGALADPRRLAASDFDEAAFLDLMRRSGFLSTLAHYNILKGWTLYALGRFDEALGYVEASRGNIHYVADQPHSAYHYLHHSLLLLRQGPSPDALAVVAGNQERLALFARYCPANFRHLHLLVEAERARVAGRLAQAGDHYDRAIEQAAAARNFYVEATACELAARFRLAQGDPAAADTYLERAHHACARWQAPAKSAALEEEFPRLRLARAAGAAEPDPLDIDTVIKATRAISGEIELSHLVDALLRIVIENAGAQRGVLLLEHEGAWHAVAAGEPGAGPLVLPTPLPMESSGLVATRVARYVARTRERVVLDNAAESPFANDRRLRERRTKSLLCAPLLGRGRLIGVFYLENDLTTGAFTPARVQLLEILLGQAAISLENARTYDALRASEARYRRLFDTTSEGIITMDPEGVVTFGNARMSQLLGYPLDEVIGRSCFELVHADDVAPLRQRLDARWRSASESYELRFRRQDGSILWAVASTTPVIEDGRFTGSFGMFTDISERRRAENELRRSNRFFRTLSRCNEILVHATEEAALLRDMCRAVVESGGFALAWAGYLGSDGTLKVLAEVAGERAGTPDTACLQAGAPIDACCPAMRAALTGEIQVVQRVEDDPCDSWRRRAADLGYGSSIALPLRAGRRLIGVLSISAAEEAAFGAEEVALLSELAGDLGFGIDGLRLRHDRELFMDRLRASMEATIQALSSTVERRDPYTAGHQRRVAQLAAAVARRMGWPEERVQALFLAGMVHDIGKIAIPAEILSKPGRLSAAELMLIRTHVEAGHEILQSVEFPWPLARIVHQHHERLDGSGYPRGLKGDAICPEARVLAVCDVVEAMTTHRPYRPGLTMEAALAEITAGQGTLYDPRVVEECAKLIRGGEFRFD